MNDTTDLAPLAVAATGVATDPAGRWDRNEARLLAYLLAGAAEGTRRREAMSSIDALACDLAQRARTADDVNLAAAAQLPVRAEGNKNIAAGEPSNNSDSVWLRSCTILVRTHQYTVRIHGNRSSQRLRLVAFFHRP